MRSEKFSRSQRPQGYLPRRQAPRTLQKSTWVGRRGRPWAAVTSASCWDGLSRVQLACAPCGELPFKALTCALQQGQEQLVLPIWKEKGPRRETG